MAKRNGARKITVRALVAVAVLVAGLTSSVSSPHVTHAQTASHGTVATDRAALMALYNGTGGGSWTRSTNWGTSNALSAWAGVTISSDGRVFGLDLSDNQLSGEIPDLSGLTSLRRLRLSDNQLSGEIPDLSGLANLEHLTLSNNQLSGEIPDLSGLANLEHLTLSNNQLSGEIPDLSGLNSLQRLDLWSNQLSGEIPDLGGLTSLQSLGLGDNELSGEIPDLGGLTSLEGLTLSDNQLSGEIPDLSGLISLWVLGLNGNQLTGEIPDLSGLTSLRYLWLANNQLTGEIPDLSGLTSLEGLTLSDNQLSGEIPDLSGLTSLRRLTLSNNQLSGELPDLSGLTSLMWLYLGGNQLSGEIPDLSGLTSLQVLNLSYNQLSGEIPDLSGLTNLEHLYLNENQLSGEIPDLSGLTSLMWLGLDGNQLSGTIPAALGNLSGLAWVRLSGNAFTGCVPTRLQPLLHLPDQSGRPAHDFIAVDANTDGDTADDGDTPGVGLPFCNLSALALSDVNLVPAFAAGTRTYTATVTRSVASTTVSATTASQFHTGPFRLDVSVRKGRTTYRLGDSVPLDLGTNHITVVATHSDGTPTLTYAVAVSRALNTPPTFDDGSSTTRALPENSGAGVDVTGGVVAATDSDSSDTLSYSLTGADADSFEIDSNGQMSTRTGVTHDFDFDGPKPSYSVNANVSDGKNAAGDADSTIDATIAVTINLTNVNEAPDITTVTPAHTDFDVAENTATTTVIATYEATDVDAETTLTWSLAGDDAGDFTITKNADGHGELRFANVPNFEMPVDADTMNDYDIRVKVQDNGIPGNRGSSNQLDDAVSVVVRVYEVRLDESAPEPWAHCLRGAVAEGFSLVVYEGGSVEELEDCARARHVSALYTTHDGVYVSYILGAPGFVNESFRELFPGGVARLTALTVRSDGPPSADPNAGDGALLPGTECLLGEVAVGFSLLVYEGGSVGELVSCAQGLHVAALYALHDGEWVSYILGAPAFVNREFRELFAEGVAPLTPLVVRSEGPAGAN